MRYLLQKCEKEKRMRALHFLLRKNPAGKRDRTKQSIKTRKRDNTAYGIILKNQFCT
jgi:hypothetical protein